MLLLFNNSLDVIASLGTSENNVSIFLSLPAAIMPLSLMAKVNLFEAILLLYRNVLYCHTLFGVSLD